MKFVGIMRVKNEARWIEASLTSQWFCDKIIVLDNHSTDDTVQICESFPNVTVVRAVHEDYNEGRDKEILWKISRAFHPEWIVNLDGDEVFESDACSKIGRAIQRDGNVIEAHMLNFWNDEETIRVDRGFGDWVKLPMWKMQDGPLTGVRMHCGIPNEVAHNRIDVELRIKHYGVIEPAMRRAKFDRYMEVDPPPSPSEGNYRELIRENDLLLTKIF